MIARSTGAAPRQRGSSDGWTLSSSWSDSSGSLISAPNAHTHTASGAAPAIRARASSSLTVLGLGELDAELAGGVGDGRRREPAPASARAVGPGDHERRPVRRARQRAQDAGRELGGAEVDGAHPGPGGSGRELGLAHGPHGLLALLARDPVEDQHAVEVVHLVLDDPCLEARGLDR